MAPPARSVKLPGMGEPTTRGPRMKLEELLLRHGAIDETQLTRAREEQKKWGGEIGRILVDLGFIGEELLMRALAHQLMIPFVDPSSIEIDPQITNAIPVQICERFGVIPVSGTLKTRTIRFATFDPTNGDHLRTLTAAANVRVEVAAATSSSIEKGIRRHYYGEAQTGSPPPPQANAEAAPSSPPSDASSSALEARIRKIEEQLVTNPHFAGITARLERLEQLAEVQIHVLRTLGDILIENGLTTRDEYLRRARKQ